MRRSVLAKSLVFLTASVAIAVFALPAVSNPAHAGAGTPAFATYAAPASLPNSNNAGEPSVGVNPTTGAVLYQANNSTYKAVFSDATVPAGVVWTNVTPMTSIFNIDPIMATDSVTGRTFAGGLNGECSILSYSDNDGGSWTQQTNACAGAFDHETIGSGPWHGAAPLGSTYSRAVYYCAQNGQDSCVTSANGGLTFGAPTLVNGVCSGLHGHVKVSADGTAYLPNSNCTGKTGGGITVDSGTTWNSYTIAQSDQPSRGFDPSVATTADNTVYEAWSAGNHHPMVGRSTTHGSSWDRITDLAGTVSPPIVASTFQATVAGDNGRLAVAFLGTQAGSGVPFDNGYHGIWNLFVSYSYDGGQTWTTVQATTDPVQRGCIWDGGGSNACRNLLDFMDASMSKDGRVVVAYADGCINTCAGAGGTEAQSVSAYATISRQSTGKGLLAAYDSSGATAPAAPSLSASAGNAIANLTWTTPSDGGSAITGYKVYRSTTSGAETLLASTGVTGSYADTTAANGTTYYYQVAAVNALGTGTRSNEASARPTAGNQSPTACFGHTETALATSVNGTCSTDPDGSVVSWSWNWGDGSAAGSASTATHTYAASGTYTVILTVTDNDGATAAANKPVTVSAGGDPDPSTPNLTSGTARSGTSAATSGSFQYYKIQVPAGKTQLNVQLRATQSCGLLGCNPDLDLYVRQGAKPTTQTYDGTAQTGSSSETVTLSNPPANWWYVAVYVYSGSAALNYTVTATYS